ncbi:MAG: TetR/AcrR family transcriptional regulator [Bacteroidaceae bacterium]|nr:TetR/AcrR family transcriptional regulator [Bacteroidaceae bacterium]
MENDRNAIQRATTRDKSAIIRQAIADFHERGIRGVTMSQISSELRMSKRTLYEIYDTKEQLLLDCLKAKSDADREEMRSIVAASANVLEAMLRLFRLRLEESHHINPVFIAELRSYKVAQEYFAAQREAQLLDAVQFLQRGVGEGVFEPGIDFEVFYRIGTYLAEAIFSTTFTPRRTIEEIFCNSVLLHIRGCTTEKGRRLVDAYRKDALAIPANN